MATDRQTDGRTDLEFAPGVELFQLGLRILHVVAASRVASDPRVLQSLDRRQPLRRVQNQQL